MNIQTGKQSKRRNQAERRSESENGLLQAAASLIVERGLAAATFENIGLRAGYSRGLATQKFGSKQGLIEALIARLQARLQSLLDERDIDSVSGLESVLTFVDVYLGNLASDSELRAYFIVTAGAVAEISDLRATFAAAHKDVEIKLEAQFLRGLADGSVRPGINPDAAALMVGALLFGLSMQTLLDPNLDLEPIRETSLTSLRTSLQS